MRLYHKPARILGVGIVTMDIINVVDHYPKEDEELRANSQYIVRGGNTANMLSVLSQFNHECYWIGSLANDVNYKFLVDDFSKNKINISFSKKLSQGVQPTSYITLNHANGSRSIVHYRNLAELDFLHFRSQLTTKILKKFDWIHFEARAIKETSLMINYVKSVAPNITISIEVEKLRDNIEALFNQADLYIFSKDYANASGFSQAKEFLNHQKKISPNADLVCSWGEKGAYVLLENNEFLSSNAFPPNKIIDTIGAGDTFNASLIHSQLSHHNWSDSLQFACKIAGKKCGQTGFNNLIGNVDVL